MAPLSKVSLIDNYELIEDAVSGPYSMLFIQEPSGQKVEPLAAAEPPTIERKLSYTIETSAFSEKRRVFEEAEAHKSCENIANEVEIKRRRTSVKRPNSETIEKPTSLPQLRSFEFNQTLGKSTPVRGEFEESLLRKLQFSSGALEDDGSKRDSLEFEESLGILTPEQMVDGMSFISVINSRTPSSECIGPIPNEVAAITKSDLPSPDEKVELAELPLSPNVVDATSTTDFSLGIIDEHMLSNLTLKTDTTMNMELPLDTINRSKEYTLTRLEQTPSPEDLPLDPTPIVESDPKTETSKSKTTSSFITSITSITSLDTGYQGDGEMSRPASRGADNSPLTRRPLPRPQTRRPDPMTDSDFYTESDADNHEENPLRGDRRAQVIDGTLYGVDPQAAADIYVNNRENMDSSGIFTDLESNSPHPNVTSDVSPSDTSTKTISGQSQNLPEVPEKAGKSAENDTVSGQNNQNKENPKKRNAPSPAVSSPSSVRSPRHTSKTEENASKKFKMPKREVVSKVKTMLETNHQSQTEKKNAGNVKKTAGKWDAVMNKISKGEPPKTNLKDVKSKVFNNLGAPKVQDVKRAGTRQVQKSPNIKARRARARTGNSKNVGSSVHSSLSDLSAIGTLPKNSTAGSTKKRDVVQVTQVLTASKLSPRAVQSQNATTEAKKPSANTTIQDANKPKRNTFAPKEKKQIPVKECGRATVKGGRTSPVVRPPVHTRAPAKPAPRVAEALAVLVQHLVFNVEAYQVPTLKREVQKFRQEAEQIRLSCQHLEEALVEERAKCAEAIEEERRKCSDEINLLIEKHQDQIAELKGQRSELERRFLEESESSKALLFRQNEDQLMTFKTEYEKLQKTHEETLEILREENEAIREQIDEKNAQIEEAKHESFKLKHDYEAKEMKLKEQLQFVNRENHIMKQELSKLEDKVKEKVQTVFEENSRLREENDRILSYSGSKGVGIQEVQSLRVVLELKQNEVAELRRALAEASQRNDLLAGAEEKAAALSARCEDLQLQLQRKCEYEQTLITENKKLNESFKEEINQKKRLCQYNEELRWKLTQNKEVVSKVLEQAEESALNRSMFSASFNERHSTANKLNLERTLSFRESKTPERCNNNRKTKGEFREDEESPPSSPKVKGVVEKSDWVSYVLDLDESPEIMAQRIVRRSFRNSTPPKTTPTKSPSNKRARMKNPLSLSASASAILPSSKVEYNRSRSVSSRNGDCDLEEDWGSPNKNKSHFDDESSESSMKLEDTLDLDEDHDVDLKLPALPSEMGRKNGAQALPSPKHLAGEAMISESNSEDESTSSSSVQL